MLRNIGGRRIGRDVPLFVIAELGLNHGGSLERALALVDAAADAGAAAIKLQTLTAEHLVCATAPPPAHLAGAGGPASLVEFFRRFELDEAAHLAIAARARTRGLAVMATPFSAAAIDLLERVGIDAYKIASGDLTYASLVARAASTGKPLVISTGMSELSEVVRIVQHARAAGAVDLALLHCVSCYPVPSGHEQLAAITELSQVFGVPVGLSDHSTEPLSAPLAVALGASIYERHLILGPGDEAVDAAVSSTPDQLRAVIAAAERARCALGQPRKTCLAVEMPNRVPSRRSLRAGRPLAPGHVIAPDDIVVLRPATGTEPWSEAALIGATVTSAIGLHEAFTVDNIIPQRLEASHAA